MPELDGRFERIRLVNFDATKRKKRGVFSLVFKAFDRIEQRDVALKFYDLDPRWLLDQYRLDSFRREHGILQTLLTRERCLQLASSLSTYSLTIPQATGRRCPGRS